MSIEGFGDIRPAPGGLERGWVEVPGVDPPWRLPIVVARGTTAGPTLAITAGLHACEYAPMEALRRFVMTVDCRQLCGTVIAALMVNGPGFVTRSVFVNPRDGKNINRVFPGSANGSPSERVANFLMTELITKSDAYIDCHCGDMVEALLPFSLWARTGDAAVDAKSEAMATVYGESMVFAGPLEDNRGMAFAEGAALGIPSALGEAGQQGICDEASVQSHVEGLQSVLGVLGMGEVASGRRAPLPMADEAWLSSNTTGIFRSVVELGDEVKAGQLVGLIRDVFGETLEEVVAPKCGTVYVLMTGLAVNAGEPVIEIGVVA